MSKKDRRDRKKQQRQERRDQQLATRAPTSSGHPGRQQDTSEAIRRALEAEGLLKRLPNQESPKQTEQSSTRAAHSTPSKTASADSEIEISSDSVATDSSQHHGHHSEDYCNECGTWHETTFRLHDMLQRHVFLALADKYGITVYRNKGSHRSSLSVRANPEFINSYFKPQLDSLIRKVNEFLAANLSPWLSSELANLPPPPSDLKP